MAAAEMRGADPEGLIRSIPEGIDVPPMFTALAAEPVHW